MSHASLGRKRIVFVSSSLGGGGAERVLITMAEYWSAAGHDVVILTLRSDPDREYGPPKGVAVKRLGLIQEHNAVWTPTHALKLWRLRREIVALEPDVVIPFIDKLNAAVLFALARTRIKVVATEHLAPWMNPLGSAWERLRVLSYPNARAVVSPTDQITQWFNQRIRGRFETLPYPSKQYISRVAVARRPVILGMGRLTPQKGFDVFIRAFAKIAPKHLEWRVEIAGEGPERASLENLIAVHGLQDRVELLGQIGDPEALFHRSEIFALTSRHEAYPMVLCEALSAGCCVLAADCPTGPREIIGSTEAAILVPPEDVDLLAQALERLIQSPAQRANLRRAAVSRAQEISPEAVMTQWSEALERWCNQLA